MLLRSLGEKSAICAASFSIIIRLYAMEGVYSETDFLRELWVVDNRDWTVLVERSCVAT